MGDWRRVTKREPCPICGRASWCVVSMNGEVCLCMRTGSEWPIDRGMGGHLHRLSERPPPYVRRPRPRSAEFDRHQRSMIAEWLLSQLTLEERHATHLRGSERRLAEEQIDRRRYCTWPSSRRRSRLAEQALEEFGIRMYEFPGYYTDRNGRPTFNGPAGLLLPVVDADECIVGLQIRPNDLNTGKRLWLSSLGRSGGTGSGAPAHFSFPAHVRDPFSVYVVEGVLNADISSDLVGSLCLGLSGKTNWRTIDRRELRLWCIEIVVIALDEDLDGDETNRRAIGEFFTPDFHVRSARWDGTIAKGFDDCLNRTGRFELT